MKARVLAAVTAALIASIAGGCANDGGLLTTQAVAQKEPAVAKADPACVALAGQIDTLRKDASVENLEKAAAAGKSTNVSVKRAALAKQAELNKANADFQAKCSPQLPKAPQTAQAPAATAAPAQQAAAAAGTDKASDKATAAAKTVAKAAQ